MTPATAMRFTAPLTLSPTHRLTDFDCGEPSLNEWLQRRALSNHLTGACRTFVLIGAERGDPDAAGGHVVGYYALAAGAVAHQEATGAVKRNMPDPIPVLVLARLAVDVRVQGMQLGAALLQDAVLRAHSVALNAGVRALLVHALNDAAKAFYLRYGFVEAPAKPMTLMLRLAPAAPHTPPAPTQSPSTPNPAPAG